MKKIYLILQFIFLFFAQISTANVNIVYIDMDNILSTSIAGKSILKQLNDVNNKAIKEFQEFENNFKEKEKKIIAQKNILSEVEFNEQVKLLKSKIKEYRESKSNQKNFFQNRLFF